MTFDTVSEVDNASGVDTASGSDTVSGVGEGWEVLRGAGLRLMVFFRLPIAESKGTSRIQGLVKQGEGHVLTTC